ncbi:MAG: amino acid-binding protein [Lachnospiraceae bacterium]|nr:amino acid-binding protein [Lachnospiraceae bacterium]MBQ7780494.1 amino acid-binding protein [Lachnospiraceae bacterium]
MYIKQLSVFIENREGRLEEVLDVLKQSGVNIVSLSLADTSEYGLLRLLVNNPEAGKKALRENGFSAMLTDVLGVKLCHRVGYLQELLEVICKNGINIEYMYALSTGTDDASIVIKTSDLEKAAAILKETAVELVTQEEIA